MSRGIRTYETGGEWVIANDAGWCAGVYDTEATARYAHRMVGDVDMEAMWRAWADEHAVPTPPMTREDVRRWRGGRP